MTTTSADPAHLVHFVEASGDGVARLRTTAGELRAALDALRASEGREAFLADVPEVDLDLSFLAQRWDRLARWLDGVAQAFVDADSGAGGPLALDDDVLDTRSGPFVAPAMEVIRRDGRLVVDSGTGADEVTVEELGDDAILVTVDGAWMIFRGGAGEVLVRLGAGNDTATAAGGFDGPGRLRIDGAGGADLLTASDGGVLLSGGRGDDQLLGGAGADCLLGGAGADRIAGGRGADRILGGAGGDVIDGDAGRDRVTAGDGDDLVYGGSGDDSLHGGAGRDHVDGGAGADHLHTGTGADIASGGEGHDTIDVGAGDDVAYGGPGTDLVTAGAGTDVVHVEGRDVVPGPTGPDTVLDHDVDLSVVDAIVIDPPEGAFADRVRSDLVTLASTERGAALLESLRGRAITVVEDLGDPGLTSDAFDPGSRTVQYALDDDRPGFGTHARTTLGRAPSYSPLVGLAHELVHASHTVNGTRVEGRYRGPDRQQLDTNRDGRVTYDDDDDPDEDGDGAPDHDHAVPNEELATTGLPVDHDEDPRTAPVDARDVQPGVGTSENDLRDELGLPRRERY